MKKNLLLSLAIAMTLPAMADINGAGYYRVENYMTERYVSVIDNRGRIDMGSTSADLQAIRLDRNLDNVLCDPASVLYFQPVGEQYNIVSQGTSVYDIINYYVTISANGEANGQKLYMAYGTYNGMTRYLGDQISPITVDEGKMSINCKGDYRKWYIKPLDVTTDNYYGPKAEINATVGTYQGLYTTVYASFPMSAYSDGVKFYTLDKIGWGEVTLKEVTGIIPPETPIIVKCAGENSADNKMNIGGEGVTIETTSDFKGAFFNCDIYGHINRVEYDPNTMRVLGVCEDGSLGFIQSDINYIPANTTYLIVPEGSPAEFKCVNEIGAGVMNIFNDDSAKSVFTIMGTKVGDNLSADEIQALPAGIYVIAGKKIIIR